MKSLAIKEQTKVIKEKRAEAKKLTYEKAIIILTETANESDETLQKINNTPGKENDDFIKEVKLVLSDLAENLYNFNKYDDAIIVDKKILKYDNNFDKSYARLFKSYLAIEKNDNAAFYGSMLKYHFPPKVLKKYDDIMPEIEKQMKEMATNYKNKSVFSELFKVKMSLSMKIKIFFFILSLGYLLYEYYFFKGKKAS